MKLFFLQAKVPVTKTFEQKSPSDPIVKSTYPNIFEVTSIEESCPDIKAFDALLRKHSAVGNTCLLKGTLRRSLKNESRKGSTETGDLTEWICLDFDKLPSTAKIDDILSVLGLSDVSYVLQWSASYLVETKDINAHVFMHLSKPMSAPLIKQWLIQLNHSISILRDSMALTRTSTAISWRLDISTCQNDKLIYIAPPVFKGVIKDPVKTGTRIKLVKKASDQLTIAGTINSPAKNQQLTNARIEELRALAGLPKKKIQYKIVGSTEVMSKPDVCTVWECKEERGFVYFNLNGGDSWGYWHHENHPEVIHNFKGEPDYLTKELLPDYWAQLISQPAFTNQSGMTFLAFSDQQGAYWRGTYDLSSDTLNLLHAKNETQVRDYAKQNGFPMGDFIPTWTLAFDPDRNSQMKRIDEGTLTINQFQPSIYMRSSAKTGAMYLRKAPKTIYRLIHHALGSDDEAYNHFINWLAFILQERRRTDTAWVLHGTQGTGKGILYKHILRPLFGTAQTVQRNMQSMNEPYNEYMRSTLIVFIDEVQTRSLMNESSAIDRLKNWITEDPVAIRAIYRGTQDCPNYCNFIFASNKPDPVYIDREDRRFNVGKYQPAKIDISKKEVEELIPQELQVFHDYLMAIKVDRAKVHTPLANEDRAVMIATNESSADKVASALLEGNLEYFIDQMPTSKVLPNSDPLKYNRVENYRKVLIDILQRTDRNTGECKIARDELMAIFDYTVGHVPDTPNKFTTYLGHHRIRTTKVWIASQAVYGIKVMWKDYAHIRTYESALAPASVGTTFAGGRPRSKNITKVK